MNDGVALYLKSFRLPTMAGLLDEAVRCAEAEQWGYGQFLGYLCESEYQDRQQRRIQRLLKASELPDDHTLDRAELELWPVAVRRMLPTLVDGQFVRRCENVVGFGLPGRGKTFFLDALGREMVLRHQYRVLRVRAVQLVERLLRAKNDLRLEQELRRLDRFDVVIIDELGYTEHRRDEMEVFFLFLSERYERRSVMISSNLVFSEWGRIFKDVMLGQAAVDRLVQHSIVLRFNNKSIRQQMAERRRAALGTYLDSGEA